MHSTDDLNDGYMGSGKRLWYSINKYGKENHKCEILEFLPNRQTLKEKETILVNERLLEDPLCMNLTLGGTGGFEIANKKITKKQRVKNGKKAGLIHKQRMIDDQEYKKHYATVARKNMLQLHMNGKVPHDGFKDKKHTKETKKHLSKCMTGRYSGKRNPQYGKCWIYNSKLECNKIIKSTELKKWLIDGWTKGRKMFNCVKNQ